MYSDQALKEKLEFYLTNHVDVDSSKVTIAVDRGVVTMTGFMTSPQEKATVLGLVESFEGVEDVVNLINIDSRNISGESDYYIGSPS